MALEPKIPKREFATKVCAKCGLMGPIDDFAPTRSKFFQDSYLPLCNKCVDNILREDEYSWDVVDALCRWADIPFIVREWSRLAELNGQDKTWPIYAQIFADECYTGIGWSDYYKQYKELRESGMLEDEIPLLDQKKLVELKIKWGANYSDDELCRLEDLYKGMLLTQNISGALQIDQAQKLCKLSLEIDSRIRAGDKDVDKFLSSYEKITKIAEFTPKNTKNAVDFDSFAEVGMWLEKRGRQNKFYDNVVRDVIDDTLKNIENFNQRLYTNEGGIGDEITQRIESLKNANKIEESTFGLGENYDLDRYDNEGYAADDDEEFKVEGS